MSDDAFRLADRLALSLKEAADSMGVSEEHLRRFLPELPHLRLGNRLLIPKDTLRDWLRERAEAGENGVDAAVSEIMDSLDGGD